MSKVEKWKSGKVENFKVQLYGCRGTFWEQ